MNPLDLIQSYYESFTKTEKNIAVGILNDPKNFARGSIDTIIKEMNISKAALIRFAKKIGYSGYAEFKFDLSRFLVSASFTNDSEGTEDSSIQLITKLYCEYITQMNDMISPETIAEISQHILKARRTKIFAFNRTSLGAHQLQMRCLKIGIDVDVVTEYISMSDVANILGNEDYCLIFTIKDNGAQYHALVDTLNSSHCKVGLITMTPQLAFVKKCNHVVALPPISKGYAQFIDEQVLYFVFVEILLNELAKLSAN